MHLRTPPPLNRCSERREKLYAERVAMAYGLRYGMRVRIARFENCYGPEGAWTGGREKAPGRHMSRRALLI